MSRFWSPIVNQLTPYVPGEQPKITNLIKLNTNESPYGPGEKTLAAIKAAASDDLRLYPDPNGDALKLVLAEQTGLTPAHVFVGNGSDEVLAHTFQALLKHEKPLLFPDISYSFYPVYCGLYDIEYQTVALNDKFDIDPADYQIANGGIIFPNPNAPTGKALELSAIRQILQQNADSVVVVDEAYVDFGADSASQLVAEFDNLLVIQTLSKSRALAGLRVGFAFGHPQLIEALERVKNSFNSYPLCRLSLAGAVASIKDTEYFKQSCARIIQSRDWVSEQLTALGFEVLPSKANFVFTHHPNFDAEKIAAALREKNIIVRYFNKVRIDQFLRISIGNEQECAALIDALKVIVGN